MLVRPYLVAKVELKSAVLNLRASALVTVAEKLASEPRAAASSLRVSSAPGAPLIRFVMLVST
jgi:hypothetical protein